MKISTLFPALTLSFAGTTGGPRTVASSPNSGCTAPSQSSIPLSNVHTGSAFIPDWQGFSTDHTASHPPTYSAWSSAHDTTGSASGNPDTDGGNESKWTGYGLDAVTLWLVGSTWLGGGLEKEEQKSEPDVPMNPKNVPLAGGTRSSVWRKAGLASLAIGSAASAAGAYWYNRED